MALRTIDLFAGCGGLSLGLAQAGAFASVLAVDSDSDAAETYRANFPETQVITGLVESVNSVPRADMVVGGPPCQGFSALNRDKVGMERRALWRQYLRVLEASHAEVFVMENVPELLRSAEFRAFGEAARAPRFRDVRGRSRRCRLRRASATSAGDRHRHARRTAAPPSANPLGCTVPAVRAPPGLEDVPGRGAGTPAATRTDVTGTAHVVRPK